MKKFSEIGVLLIEYNVQFYCFFKKCTRSNFVHTHCTPENWLQILQRGDRKFWL